MTLPIDLTNETGEKSAPVELGEGRRPGLSEEKHYKPSRDLADAIKVALLLRKPLLVTGEPGTGKTDLGRYIAWKCGFRHLKFAAKSDTGWRDPYYSYDALGRFQARQSGAEGVAARDFFRLNALGEAIVRSHPTVREDLRDVLPMSFLLERAEQSVVVVDEIDKAPRDFPNDLLNELEEGFFQIPELNIPAISADPKLTPFLVITSNSEKNLPAAFLRRCVYHHIEFPKDEEKLKAQLAAIVSARIGEFTREGVMLREALDLFVKLRGAGLTKAPATAELLDWMLALVGLGANPALGLKEQSGVLFSTLPALVKEPETSVALGVAEEWAGKKRGA